MVFSVVVVAFTWEEKQFSWAVIPQGFTESPFYFSQILKVEPNDKMFPRGPILLQDVDDLLLCSPPQTLTGASISLLKLLALKRKITAFPNPGLI